MSFSPDDFVASHNATLPLFKKKKNTAGQLGQVVLFAPGRGAVGALLPHVFGAQFHQFRALRRLAPAGARARRSLHSHAPREPPSTTAVNSTVLSIIVIVIIIVVVIYDNSNSNSNSSHCFATRCCGLFFFSVSGIIVSSSTCSRSCFGRGRSGCRRH